MPCQLTVSKVLRRSLTISALAAALGAIACTRSSSSVAEITGRQPDIILITIDALRADHLGIYG
jgi:hypothetical protein